MVQLYATRFLYLCLALAVVVQFAMPMAASEGPACHTSDLSVTSADMSAPSCPEKAPVCSGKGCLSHVSALPTTGPHVPAACQIGVPATGCGVAVLHPMQIARNLMRPPNA